MFTSTCSECQREEVPLREFIRVDGRLVCGRCFDRLFPSEEDQKGKLISRLSEMTSCAFCGKQAPEVSIKNMGGSPVCITCSNELISKPFPIWVKAFFTGVLLLVVLSIVWNWRFLQGYWATKDMERALATGDLERAVRASDMAMQAVPEQDELALMSDYFHGIQLLKQDSSRAALKRFETVAYYAPGKFELGPVMQAAKIGVAFDDHDYDTFLTLTREAARAAPMEPMNLAALSSALACKYAVSGDTAVRDSAMMLITKALSITPNDTVLLEYVERLNHRLTTREIIDRSTFHERFPNGWKP
ncbi:MAG: hypothetical protein JNL43_01050 [Flavobacteriales bacterium]|nr:hypothetical protein [Flavobacteriales bacterium]